MSFYVKIKNSENKEVLVNVSFEIHQLFEDEEKETHRYKMEIHRRRPKKHIEIEDILKPQNPRQKSALEEYLIQSELKKANEVIDSCTEIQQRRFNLYRIMGYSLTEIAKAENCSVRAVKHSVDVVIKKLEEIKKSF